MPEKKTTRSQSNFFQRFADGARQFFRETVGELRKVSWPTRQEAFNLTKIVLFVIGAMTIFLGVLDFIYTFFFKLLLGA